MTNYANLPAFIGTFRGPCAFCGHADARHRMVDTITERYTAGETVEALAQDYRCTAEDMAVTILQTLFPDPPPAFDYTKAFGIIDLGDEPPEVLVRRLRGHED